MRDGYCTLHTQKEPKTISHPLPPSGGVRLSDSFCRSDETSSAKGGGVREASSFSSSFKSIRIKRWRKGI